MFLQRAKQGITFKNYTPISILMKNIPGTTYWGLDSNKKEFQINGGNLMNMIFKNYTTKAFEIMHECLYTQLNTMQSVT